jgi:hypothetical protein
LRKVSTGASFTSVVACVACRVTDDEATIEIAEATYDDGIGGG